MIDRLRLQPKAAKKGKALAVAAILLGLLAGFASTRTTYTIHDGEQVYEITTYSGSVEEAYTRAGITVDAVDRVIESRTGNNVTLSIARAKSVTINIDGERQSTLAYDQTVSDLLQEQAVSLGKDDLISVPLDVVVTEGMTIAITRRLVTHTSERIAIPYETTRVANPELDLGLENIAQAGVAGERLITTQTVAYTNGDTAITSKEEIVAEPINEIVEYGTKVYLNSLSVSRTAIVKNTSNGTGGTLSMTDGSTLNYSQHISATATAYYAGSCDKAPSHPAYGITATGTRAKVGTVAVDPRVIPYGTKMYIVTTDGTIIYGIATAEDCGGSIKGNRVDLYFDTRNECFSFGRRGVEIYILE